MTDISCTLVADIGGTNTRVALADGTQVRQDTIRKYSNANHAGLAEVLRDYLSTVGGAQPSATCIAVAGPVHNGQAELTNLAWSMDLQLLRDTTGAHTVDILNDLQAQGYAIGHVSDANLDSVQAGQSLGQLNAASVVIGVGTGFNIAPVLEAPFGRMVPPSETGHTCLPVRSDQDIRLAQFLADEVGFASIEDVLSGRGLENTYRFIGQELGDTTALPAHDIMAACAAGDKHAVATVHLCVKILGDVCGNIALMYLPFGGVYLIGGVARALAPYFSDGGFRAAFRDKGRFSDYMDQFPIKILTDDFAALTGCAAHMEDFRLAKP